MKTDKLGRFVWHDLFTPDVQVSKAFYEGIAAWRFVTEHATNFTWGKGEGDFFLAFSGEEAGVGFAETPVGQRSGWVPYVEVEDVDAAAALAQDLRGIVEKDPFEVPGVGRNCLLRDPSGARIGICVSRHNFPAPTVQFGAERYLSRAGDFPADFYDALFGWSVRQSDAADEADLLISLQGELIALQTTIESSSGACGLWAPSIRLSRYREVKNSVRGLGGTVTEPSRGGSNDGNCFQISDPNGALSYLVPLD